MVKPDQILFEPMTNWTQFFIFLLIGLCGLACYPEKQFNYIEKGSASFYHQSLEGNQTANGEIFNNDSMTAAHRTLPFGTRVFVLDTMSERSVWVRINDRGPYVNGRIIDLSRKAAADLGILEKGTTGVIIKATLPKRN